MSNSMDEILMIRETENEENKDRLSDFPDSILLHILSFMNAIYAVRTCILSTRWKDLWRRLPTLILHSQDFSSWQSCNLFQYRFFTHRDGSTALHGLHLQCLNSESMAPIQPQFIVRMVYYAVSHNVRRLGIHSDYNFFNLLAVLPYIFTCHTLTSLKLILGPDIPRHDTGSYLFPESMNLPALTTLHLRNFTFCSSGNGRADPFSRLNRLKSLIIDQCNLKDAQILCITSMTLVSLTLHNHRPCSPRHDYYKTELCTPCLYRFVCTECPSQYLYGSGLFSVKEVNIEADLCMYNSKPPLILLSWLRELVNITSLTVTKRTLQVLFLVPDLLKIKLPSLANLKRLKVVMISNRERAASESHKEADKSRREANKFCNTRNEETAPLPDGIVDFLIQNSPSAEVKIIDCLM